MMLDCGDLIWSKGLTSIGPVPKSEWRNQVLTRTLAALAPPQPLTATGWHFLPPKCTGHRVQQAEPRSLCVH